jgi:hypothetical protein
VSKERVGVISDGECFPNTNDATSSVVIHTITGSRTGTRYGAKRLPQFRNCQPVRQDDRGQQASQRAFIRPTVSQTHRPAAISTASFTRRCSIKRGTAPNTNAPSNYTPQTGWPSRCPNASTNAGPGGYFIW